MISHPLQMTAMNKSEFQQKLSDASKPVIVDFWAAWCAPCMKTKPILEKIAIEYVDKVEFMPINADNSRELLEHFRVYSIPTVLTLRAGKEVGRFTGAQNEAIYRTIFEALAEGKEVKVSIAQFDRILRLGAGALLIIVGLSTQSWIVAIIGGLMAFMGIYDRCPIWNAIKEMFKRS